MNDCLEKRPRKLGGAQKAKLAQKAQKAMTTFIADFDTILIFNRLEFSPLLQFKLFLQGTEISNSLFSGAVVAVVSR